MKYTNLVISGGGLNGYYFLGSLKYLYENNLLNIKTIFGVSIGAVICFLLVIGYDINFLCSLFSKINIQKYIPEINVDNILDEYYFFDNNKFDKIIEYLTKKKNLSTNITLQELYNLTNIELIIGTSNISNSKYECISHTNYPTLHVLTALKMSYAIPIIFKPIIHNNMYYVDGALMNNFPIKYFKKDIKNTIGITILNNNIQITDIMSYFKYITKAITSSKHNHNFPNNTIFIQPTIHFGFFDVVSLNNLEQKRIEMIDSGYKCAKIFFDNKYNFIKNILLDIIDNIK